MTQVEVEQPVMSLLADRYIFNVPSILTEAAVKIPVYIEPAYIELSFFV